MDTRPSAAGPTNPTVSILTPVYDPPLDVLRDTIESVRAQSRGDWEWILVDDCSPNPSVRTVLRTAATADPRIRVIERETNGHIVVASNDALAAARGTYVALLDHDDLLAPTALERTIALFDADDEMDYVYTDEDKVDASGHHYDVFRKPVWSPERLRGQMYTSHFSVMRRSVVDAVGGFRAGFDGSQDHDLALRVTERARRIGHIPEVLYHWRVVTGSAAGDVDAKPYAQDAGLRAVTEHLERVGIDGVVAPISPYPGHYRIHRHLPPERRVSIVIPTLGQSGLVWGSERVFVVEAVRSALEHTDHENVEVVVVYDASTPAAALRDLREIAGDKLVLVHYGKPFNFSEKINVGVLASSGDRIVLLNDDVQVRSERWIEDLVGPLEEPDVGMTGARLYFDDGTIQHVGHQYPYDEMLHSYLGAQGHHPGRFGDIIINREVSGVTAACAAITRETFMELGGLCESLPVNFNDVDLCRKVTSAGLRIVYVAGCELYHFESRTRSRDVHGWEHQLVLERWGKRMDDPYLPVG